MEVKNNLGFFYVRCAIRYSYPLVSHRIHKADLLSHCSNFTTMFMVYCHPHDERIYEIYGQNVKSFVPLMLLKMLRKRGNLLNSQIVVLLHSSLLISCCFGKVCMKLNMQRHKTLALFRNNNDEFTFTHSFLLNMNESQTCYRKC